MLGKQVLNLTHTFIIYFENKKKELGFRNKKWYFFGMKKSNQRRDERRRKKSNRKYKKRKDKSMNNGIPQNMQAPQQPPLTREQQLARLPIEQQIKVVEENKAQLDNQHVAQHQGYFFNLCLAGFRALAEGKTSDAEDTSVKSILSAQDRAEVIEAAASFMRESAQSFKKHATALTESARYPKEFHDLENQVALNVEQKNDTKIEVVQ